MGIIENSNHDSLCNEFVSHLVSVRNFKMAALVSMCVYDTAGKNVSMYNLIGKIAHFMERESIKE